MIPVLRLQARRDRVVLPIWILAIALVVLASTSAVSAEFGDEESRGQVLRLALATPSLLALRGVPDGASLGSFLYFQLFTFLAVAVGLMNTFLAARHGRGDEEAGRRELVSASPIPRSATLLGLLLLGTAANVVLAAAIAAAFLAGGLPLGGSVLAGAALGATGLAFLGVGALLGELVPTARAASGAGATLVVAAYALRAAGDALGTPDLDALTLVPAWPSWLSPIGWGQQTFAFTRADPAPLLLSLALALGTAALAVGVHARRDLGASLLPERRGRQVASAALRSPRGLAWRVSRTGTLAWAIGAGVLGLATASLATAVGGASIDNPQIARVLASLAAGDQDDITATFVAAIMVLVGILAAAAGVQAVLRLRDDESSGRAELLLSTPVRRVRWLLSAATLGLSAVAIVLLATAATAAAGFASAGDLDGAPRAVGQALAQFPAAAAAPAAAALLVAVLPRLATGLTWALFGAAVVVGLLGQLLGLPDAVLHASPFADVPSVPVDDWAPILVLLAVDAVLLAAAAAAVRRRDLTP